MASASGEVEGAITDSYMTVLTEQQEEKGEEVLPPELMCGGGVDLFDHIDDLVPVFPKEDTLDFISSGNVLLDDDIAPYEHYLHLPGSGIVDTHSGVGGDPLPLHLPFHHDDEDGCLDHSFITIPSKDVDVSDQKNTTTSNHRHQLFEHIADLEWLSTFMDEPFSLDLFPSQDDYFQTLSPVSVLEPNGVTTEGGAAAAAASSSTCSSTTTTTTTSSSGGGAGSGRRTAIASPDLMSVVPARARSKRPRPAALGPRLHLVSTVPFLPRSTDLPLPPDESAIPTPTTTTGLKFKIIKKTDSHELSSASNHVVGEVDQSGSARKCTHCQIQKTPQWRAGPMGPKTLCNACGVRYKSGRLFPEYRPAASPTFVPSLHSNSHKKVVEMRINNATTSRSCDLLDYIRLRPPTRGD